METVKLPLTEKINAHGKDVTELFFKKPNGGTIRRCGSPLRRSQQPNGEVDVKLDMQAYAAFISECAQIPDSSVDSLSPEDFFAAVGVIDGFFGQTAKPDTTPPTSSSDTTS